MMIQPTQTNYEKKANVPLLRRIKKLNDKLNGFNYGVVLDGQAITDDSEIEAVFRKNLYRTLSCKEFIKYRTGVCWDYTHYEAIYFLRRLGMRLVKDDWLRFDNTFSMYYMEFYENEETDPSNHTWLAFRLNGKVYSFESSWKQYRGVTPYSGEFSMIADYMRKNSEFYESIGVSISKPSIYKYEPLKPGLDWKDFIDQAKDGKQSVCIVL